MKSQFELTLYAIVKTYEDVFRRRNVLTKQVAAMLYKLLFAQRVALQEMMPCGHPVAAMNLCGNAVGEMDGVGQDTSIPRTMFCRSCSFDGAKELAKVLTANRGTVPSGETK